MPALFTSTIALSLAAMIGIIATVIALFIEERLTPYEARIASRLQTLAVLIGPIFLRVSLATMLALAGTGGLPRHGTAHWIEPTYFVPDMQLSLIAGWDWLAMVQIALAAIVVLGLFIRLAGIALIVLSGLGLALFGAAFLSYAPHFIAPGLVLILTGAGPCSLDRALGLDRHGPPEQILWRIAQILVGAGFVYLAVAYKLTQPTLLIAILQHGQMPTFGLPYALIALVMTGIEIICGALLMVGRMIRPVSLLIIGAITFLAVTLGETPLFHANLYGILLIFALMGRDWPASSVIPTSHRRALA